MSKVSYFEGPVAFRAWLDAHHQSADELLVGFFKVGTGQPSMSWEESVDEALCFGWIDGIRRRVDDERYTIRFTPRRASSKWSAKNVASVGRLKAEGRMRPAGLAAFEAGGRGEEPAGYSFERPHAAELSAELRQRVESDSAAWAFFESQPPGHRRTILHWVMSAKREETRRRRLDRVLDVSRAGERIDLVNPFGPR